MSIVVKTRAANRHWLLLLVAIAAIGMLYYLPSPSVPIEHAEQQSAAFTEPTTPSQEQSAPLPSAQLDSNSAMPTSEQALLTQQSKAKQAVAASAQSASTPSTTNTAVKIIKERPDYLSPMEWLMMKGVAAQHASPDTELTRMVRFVHFMKRWEHYEQLQSSAPRSKRAALAKQLLNELPQRVRNGELGMPEAKVKMQLLVTDAAEPGREQENLANDSLRLLELANETAQSAQK